VSGEAAGASVLWRRLDAPGHDACRLQEDADGWRLEGAAAFADEKGPVCLTYSIITDRAWHTREGHVRGWLGARRVEYHIVHAAGAGWSLNGSAVPGLEECLDVDYGFTPATNLLSLRRLALAVGQSAEVAAAWLDVAAGTLDVLAQRYQRRTDRLYGYESPRFGYAAVLEVNESGFVHRYPTLWEEE
jgi:uncharacterized protein